MYNVILRSKQSFLLSWIRYENKESFDTAFNEINGGLRQDFDLVEEGISDDRAVELQTKGTLVKTREHHDRILKDGGVINPRGLDLAWENYKNGALAKGQPVDEKYLGELVPGIIDYINANVFE